MFSSSVKPVVVAAPAKLNLFLAITGRRPDGFHNLVSVVAPVEFGDTLRAETADTFTLTCDDPAVPVDESNLVLKAAAAFTAATSWRGGAKFTLEKRIPMGAGLGGGSSNAVAALRALNTLAGQPLATPALVEIAAGLGSDCALFLHDGPVVMRGRGERVEALPRGAAERLRGRRVLIFKPDFGISTPWAYRTMAADSSTYFAEDAAEARLAAWLGDDSAATERLLFNNMESVAFRKFVALPVLLEQLRRDFTLEPRMSGSGSACFALLPESAPIEVITAAVRAAWGDSAFVIDTRIA
jgi:4-diphosphocytidyl-2-C-methyl-D-erythritol kinase